MTSQEIRQAFLDFFIEKGHEIVSSSSLIPSDDPTLLFTNAGMNQFKPVLLGQEKRSYVRAANSQKCMRVSGKHNDLEAVGRDGRHHTFFEMLGNWSFGDYYKEEAITWAWEFLVDRMKLDADRLWVSVYKDDDESARIWTEVVGISPERVVRLGDIGQGDEENFWSMGDTGPCGPCTEIHYDQGVEVAGGVDLPLGEDESDRWLEIWNLVFIQYDRDSQGELSPLPLQSVDTGMGLERLAALKAGVTSNYASDLFEPLTHWVARHSGRSPEDPEDKISMQVIADHARAVTFTVADGGRPGNDGRGYVLRRILRRAARHGRRLGFTEPFLFQVADQVIELMGGHFHELVQAREHVLRVVRTEEERFNETLDRGLQRFAEFEHQARERGDDIILGEQAFMLHDTFGFPLDLTEVMAEEKQLKVDGVGFDRAMEAQRARARSATKFAAELGGAAWQWIAGGEPGAERDPSRFVGHERLRCEAKLIGLRAMDDRRFELMLDQTPFYAESGGQVGDVGLIEGDGLRLRVVDTQSGAGGPVHRVEVEQGSLGDTARLASMTLSLRVDADRRAATMRNHTGTHLLHAALRKHLGEHATQAGSLVAPDRLRFDFHHEGAVGRDRLDAIEAEVNLRILEDRGVAKHVDVPLKKAREMGAIAMFGEKYGETVRVVQVDDVSIEFCGGTHCDRTGQIGLMRIIGESAVGAGIRRVEALTGTAALESLMGDRDIVRRLGEQLSAKGPELLDRVGSLQSELKSIQSELNELRKAQAGDVAGDLVRGARLVDGVKLVAEKVETPDRESLLQMGDKLRQDLGSGAAVLAAELDGKVAFLAVVTDDLIKKHGLKAGDLVQRVAAIAGGGGGGRPHLAQAGGKDPAKIPAAIEAVPGIVRELIGGA